MKFILVGVKDRSTMMNFPNKNKIWGKCDKPVFQHEVLYFIQQILYVAKLQ